MLLDEGRLKEAVSRAHSAMIQAARSLAREKNPNLGPDPDEVVSEFRKYFYDTQLFFDPYAGGKFAQYLFHVHEEHQGTETQEAAHQLIEEATLFVDAAHQCYARLGASLGAPVAVVTPAAPGAAPGVGTGG
jgi:sulfite reductase (ferredoxin)